MPLWDPMVQENLPWHQPLWVILDLILLVVKILNGEDLLSRSVDERARAGLFLGMQYPAEVSGVTNSDFLRSAVNARRETPLGVLPFLRQLNEAVSELEMRETLPDRYLNEGFSGGEKKRDEILQMKLLNHPSPF